VGIENSSLEIAFLDIDPGLDWTSFTVITSTPSDEGNWSQGFPPMSGFLLDQGEGFPQVRVEVLVFHAFTPFF
jgi:hypothetical protein